MSVASNVGGFGYESCCGLVVLYVSLVVEVDTRLVQGEVFHEVIHGSFRQNSHDKDGLWIVSGERYRDIGI